MIIKSFEKLVGFFAERNIKKQQVIYKNGQLANGFYYLKSGLVGLYQVSELGNESLLRIYSSGAFFGYRSLFTEQAYPATARAMLDTELFHIDIQDLKFLNDLAPEIANQLTREVCTELGQAEERLMQFNTFSAKKRILDAIHYVFLTYPQYPWTYREIGEFSGTDISTVIRFCKTLKALGILQKDSRKPQPVDLAKLESYRKSLINE